MKNAHRVEIITNVKGTTIICRNESPDMYSSIDSVSHALNRKLRKYKERRTEGWHGGAHMGEDLLAALDSLEELPAVADDEAGEEFVDEYAPSVTTVRSFDLENPITLDEAVFALDYVDHDFYVFRNEETKKINVVYKRPVGDVGLIEED